MMRSQRSKAFWTDAESYEAYIGRWSRVAAAMFVEWLTVRSGSTWLDVGSGTGALTQAILDYAEPARITGVDHSRAFVAYARANIPDPRVEFEQADASRLTMPDDTFDAVVSGLALNAFPDQPGALAEFARVAKPGGVIAAYLWDFDGEMQVLRCFWDAAKWLEPGADAASDNDPAFEICRPDRLECAFKDAGLRTVEIRALDVPAHFRDFEDYWAPLQRGHAPSQQLVASLSEEKRSRLRERLLSTLPAASDGSIDLIARAWAAKGVKPRRSS